MLAATASDVCALAHAPFCALSSVHRDDAFVLAVHGARNRGAPLPGTSWRVSDVLPAPEAVASARAVSFSVTGA